MSLILELPAVITVTRHDAMNSNTQILFIIDDLQLNTKFQLNRFEKLDFILKEVKNNQMIDNAFHIQKIDFP